MSHKLTLARINSLLIRHSEGKINGPMSPMLAAKTLVEQGAIFDFNRLIRVHWDDPLTLQVNEGTRRKPEWTGMDTLMAGRVTANGKIYLALFLDMGHELLPIAIDFDNDDEEPTITSIYHEYAKKFNKAPTDEQLNQLFHEVRWEMITHPDDFWPNKQEHAHQSGHPPVQPGCDREEAPPQPV